MLVCSQILWVIILNHRDYEIKISVRRCGWGCDRTDGERAFLVQRRYILSPILFSVHSQARIPFSRLQILYNLCKIYYNGFRNRNSVDSVLCGGRHRYIALRYGNVGMRAEATWNLLHLSHWIVSHALPHCNLRRIRLVKKCSHKTIQFSRNIFPFDSAEHFPSAPRGINGFGET